MTDKEKRELKDGVISIFKSFNILDHTATIEELRNAILAYINSMQEEPVSIWHDAGENPKEEEYLICVYKDNRYHIGKIYKDGFGRLLVSDNKNIIELCMFEKWAYIDDMLNLPNVERTVKDWKEMPVSEELEKAAVEAFKQIVDSDKNNFLEIFKAGAEWEKNQAMAEIQAQSMALAHGCPEEKTNDDLKKAADNALESITDQYDIISVGSCLEMFRLGSQWQKEKDQKK